MNKIQSALLGGIMALSLAACNTTDPELLDTTAGSTGTWGSSSGSGQTGTNTGITNDVDPRTANPGTLYPPATTSYPGTPTNVPAPAPLLPPIR